MATDEELQDSIQSFARSCTENERLKAINRGWNRIIHIHATDLNQHYTLTTQAGEVTCQSGAVGTADMAIIAIAEILTAVFYGEVSPNEPYNEGTLRVQGSEDDVLHLDFITAMLWE